ncbi:hypothetical protein N9L68_08125 [bacterium]|nr:hypothetical protein [bacterium]
MMFLADGRKIIIGPVDPSIDPSVIAAGIHHIETFLRNIVQGWVTDCQDLACALKCMLIDWQPQKDTIIDESNSALRKQLFESTSYRPLAKGSTILGQWRTDLRCLSQGGGGELYPNIAVLLKQFAETKRTSQRRSTRYASKSPKSATSFSARAPSRSSSNIRSSTRKSSGSVIR